MCILRWKVRKPLTDCGKGNEVAVFWVRARGEIGRGEVGWVLVQDVLGNIVIMNYFKYFVVIDLR
jgi:hypothetical protein